MSASSAGSAPVGTPSRLPVLFIGSATEDLQIADTVQLQLDHDAEGEIWTEGMFIPSGHAVSSPLATAQRVDFAVMIASPVDTLSTRGTTLPASS